MKGFNEIIEELSIGNLLNCQFEYTDQLDYSELEGGESFEEGYWMWKYYSGSITSEEHQKYKENGNIKNANVSLLIKIYDYIFEVSDASKIEDGEANEIKQCLINLYIMRPRENFSYEEKFKKLIFYTYLHTKDNCFREPALEYFSNSKNQYDNLIKANNCDDMFLIKRPDKERYNTKYGIQCKSCEEKSSKNTSSDNDSNCSKEENKDWISDHFCRLLKEEKTNG